MEGWVDLGYPAMHRLGVELAISWSQVRRPTTKLPSQLMSSEHIRPSAAVYCTKTKGRLNPELDKWTARNKYVLVGEPHFF